MLQMPQQNDDSRYGLPGATRDELTTTLRSFRDTLSISLQNLNLTLSSMTNAVRNMGQKASGVYNFMNPQGNLIPGNNQGIYAGGLSNPMQGFLSNASTFDLMSSQRPYNVDPYEFYAQRNLHRTGAVASLMANSGLTAASLGMGAVAGNMFANKMAKVPLIGRLPKFALGMGGMMGAGLLLDPLVEKLGAETQSYIADTTALKRMSTKFGNEFTFNQAGRVSSGIRSMAYNEAMQSTGYDTVLGQDGYRNMLMKGLQNNLFHGSSPEELKKQMEQGAKVVRLLTGILGSKDINETMDSIAKIKGMGVNLMNNPKLALNLSTNAFKYGATMGMSGSAVMGMAAMGAQNTFGAYGLPAFGGINPFMRSMALAHEMEKRHMLSAAEVAGAGGHQGLAQNYTAGLAAMMKSGQIGDMFLASGGQGNGYFGMLGNATKNLVGSPYKMAAFMNNKTNSWAKLMENDQGEKGIIGTLRKAVYQMPFMQGNVSHGNQFEMAQAHVRQILQSMGGPTDDATVKMFATKIVYPNRVSALEQEANRHADRGTRDMMRDKMGIFRGFERIGEGFGRMGASWDYMFQRAGSALGRIGLSAFEDDYMPLSITGGAPISDYKVMSNVRELSRFKSGNMSKLSGSQIAAARNIAAIDYAGINTEDDAAIPIFGNVFGSIHRKPSFIANALNGGRALAPGYLAEKARQMDWYYNDKDYNLGMFSQANVKGYTGKELGDFRSGFDYYQKQNGVGNWFDSKNATVNAGVNYTYKAMMKAGTVSPQANYDMFKAKYKNIAAGAKLSDDVMGMLNDKTLSTGDLRMRLANDPSIRAQAQGQNLDRYVASIMELHDRGGLTGDASDLLAYGTDEQRTALKVGALAVRDKDNFQQDGQRLTMGNLRMGNEAAGKAARDLGLSDDVLAGITSNASRSQVEAAGKIIDKWLAGESYSNDLGGLGGNKELEAFVKSQLGRDKGDVKDNYRSLGVGSMSEGLQSLVGLKARLRGESTYGSVFGLDKGKEIFGQLAGDNVDGALKSILGVDAGNDAHAKGMQDYTRRLMGAKGNKDQLLSLLGEQIGMDNVGQFKGKSADELMKTALDAAMTSTGLTKDAENQAKDLEDRDIRKAVTKGSSGQYALRVVIDSDFKPSQSEVAKMRDAEEKAKYENVTADLLQDNKGTGGSGGSNPGTTKNTNAQNALINNVTSMWNSGTSLFKNSIANPSTWNSYMGV